MVSEQRHTSNYSEKDMRAESAVHTLKKDLRAEMQFLARSWLDDFEKQVFSGKTVQDICGRSYE